MGVQATRLEAVDDAFDPLGPLGAESEPTIIPAAQEQAPTPPRKEAGPKVVRQPTSQVQPVSAADDADNASLPNRQRGPPPVQPAAGVPVRQTQPSISIEQAAKPTFDITVGDPHKVGDLTSSHIVYQVRTKVRVARLDCRVVLTMTIDDI